MKPTEAIIRLEMDRHLRLLWLDFKTIYECGELSDLEADIWAAIAMHPTIQKSLSENSRN